MNTTLPPIPIRDLLKKWGHGVLNYEADVAGFVEQHVLESYPEEGDANALETIGLIEFRQW